MGQFLCIYPNVCLTPKVANTAPNLIIASTMAGAVHVYILNIDLERWHVCDKHCLLSWIRGISAIATDVETLYVASHEGSVTALSPRRSPKCSEYQVASQTLARLE